MLLKISVVLALVALTSGQRRYYSLEDMPDTNFDCRDKILGGYYADPEANCQMFHVCVKIPGQGVQDFRFLCPNETVFDQENQICADSGDIDCEASGLYLENFDLYRIGSAQAKRPVAQFGSSKGTALPLGPSTKSPILTNNVYEDDDFYLQKSETGDRRLHSKDLLRGSSSSNFFNNRNKGKDLEEDDEDSAPKSNNNNQFRPRPNAQPQPRPKTQYQSQFRKAEQPITTTQQPVVDNQNQFNDKKRTKVAVRKLARKRPSDDVAQGQQQQGVPQGAPQGQFQGRPTPQPQQPNFSTITTQVTQKYAFGDQNSRYNTVNRQPTTPPTVGTSEVFRQQPQQQPAQQPQQQQQQRFQNFRRPEQQSTLAFFEPSPTASTFPKAAEPKVEGNKDTTPFSLLRNPIVAAGPNFQNNQNRGSTNYQQSRATTPVANNQPVNGNQNFQGPTANGKFPSPTPAGNQNFQGGNFQQQRTNFQQPQQNNFQANQNFQQNQNYQNFQQNRPTTPFPQQRPNNGNFQQNRQQPPVNNGNFQNQQVNNGNFQQNRQQVPQARQTAAATANRGQNFNGQAFNNGQANFNNGQQNRQNAPQQQQRQFFNRNFDDFEEGDNQEFLKTAPSNNFRPSDLNSFNNNNYKSEDKSNATKFTQTSTTKYYTPTIITTPKTTPAYDSPTTLRQFNNNFFSTQVSTAQPSNFYTPTVSTTTRIQPAVSSTFQPPSSRLPQRIYPSPTPSKATETKDASYDYAYYDDAGSFSEYDGLDNLGEPDFSRTSQRTKSRLI